MGRSGTDDCTCPKEQPSDMECRSPPATAGEAVTVFFVPFAIGKLVVGPLSDHYGRRPIIFGGIAVFVGGTLLCLVARSMPTLLLGRISTPLGATAPSVLSRAIAGFIPRRGIGSPTCFHHHCDCSGSGSLTLDRWIPAGIFRLACRLPLRRPVRGRCGSGLSSHMP